MQYDIVMEGGGAKGIVFVGALQEFEERGHTFDRMLGTSAGAISAALLAAGYSSSEIVEALQEEVDGRPVFHSFMSTPDDFSDEEKEESVTAEYLREIDIPFMRETWEDRFDGWLVDKMLDQDNFRHLFSFVERGGWYSAEGYLAWMREKLNSGEYIGQPRDFGDMSLSQFHAATGTELTLIAADTTGRRMLVLNHITAPDCPLLWATRMSMSIPLLWEEVTWDKTWGLYRGKPIAGNKIVDGGVISNFPIELYISDLDHVTAVMGPKRSENIVGLMMDEALEVKDAPPRVKDQSGGLTDFGDTRTMERFGALLNTIISSHDKMVLESFENLVIRLPAKGYGTVEFDMSPERREALIVAGREATRIYFDVQPMAAPAVDAGASAQAQHTADSLASRMLDQ
jgi:NTE family protein